MTTAAATRARVERLAALCAEAGLDAIVATKDASIAYLTGFHGLQLERLMAAVVRADGTGALVVPALDRDGVAAAPTDCEPVLYDATSNGIPELVGALRGARRVGVEEDHLSHGRALALADAGVEPVPAAATVMRLRVAKDAEEAAAIRRACTVVGEVMEELFAELRPGMAEREVNALAEYRLRRRGAAHAHTLVLFGDHASQPHGEPSDRVLQVGDVVCADLSASVDGYWGDLTRCGTVGEPGEWARRAWAVVREAYDAAMAAAKAGAPARDVDAAQRAIVEAAPDVGDCLHGAGHAIGLEVHEPPFLIPRSDDVLVAGTVLTIEPGIYRTGHGGIRLEDDVLVGADGPELLSHLPLELRHIPADAG
ncbi:MAG: aminopeptidase P family protein [Solirubrobacteraceae bacterium]|nr:aminopeptidase P family protein [Solirubrobacteraceae bacterium]